MENESDPDSISNQPLLRSPRRFPQTSQVIEEVSDITAPPWRPAPCSYGLANKEEGRASGSFAPWVSRSERPVPPATHERTLGRRRDRLPHQPLHQTSYFLVFFS